VFKFPFIPREEKFFDLFEEGAQNMVKAAQGLKEMVYTWEDVEGKVGEITELEHHGDTITHQIMAQLHRTFVTPFDREDIALLAHSLDDVTDFIYAAADAMLIYKVDPPSQRAKELADIIVQATAEVERAMPELRHRAGLRQIPTRCVEINRLENMADRVFRSAMGELFNDSSDMAQVIKWREVYEHMESATDRCEDVANVLEGVALKHA
jgi:predicted phosphate transport protein (TIGR00153 family)